MTPITRICMASCLVLFAACSDDEDPSAPETKPILQGAFVDSRVIGMAYESDTQSGRTDEFGGFEFRAGETITFSMGAVELPTGPADHFITPVTLAGASAVEEQVPTNIARLLLSLDADSDPSNGLDVSTVDATNPIDFDLPTHEFEIQSSLEELLDGKTLVAAATAQGHVRASIAELRDSIGGAWGGPDGGAFRYLILTGAGDFVWTEPGDTRVGSYGFDPLENELALEQQRVAAVLHPDGRELSLESSTPLQRLTDRSRDFPTGVWTLVTGEEYHYLGLFDDDSFVYVAQTPTAGGVEVGSYRWSGSTLTFTPHHDTNDAGLGELNTPTDQGFLLANGARSLIFDSGLSLRNDSDG